MHSSITNNRSLFLDLIIFRPIRIFVGHILVFRLFTSSLVVFDKVLKNLIRIWTYVEFGFYLGLFSKLWIFEHALSFSYHGLKHLRVRKRNLWAITDLLTFQAVHSISLCFYRSLAGFYHIHEIIDLRKSWSNKKALINDHRHHRSHHHRLTLDVNLGLSDSVRLLDDVLDVDNLDRWDDEILASEISGLNNMVVVFFSYLCGHNYFWKVIIFRL